MELGTIFKLSLYGLMALIGAILGAAEGEGGPAYSLRSGFVLPFLSLPAVVFGCLLTEFRSNDPASRRRGLNAIGANVLGMIALVATAFEFTSKNGESKLLAGTHLLLYVTWIVLFQQKTVRMYWFLMALGVLQLAVASVLTSKGWFGFCAVVYMFGAVWTLSIFSLWRAETLFADEDLKRLEARNRQRDDKSTSLPFANGIRSEVRSSVQHESGTRWLSVRFVTGVLTTTCSALLVSAAFFAFIPRVWVGPEISLAEDSHSSLGPRKKTALASTVRLGDFGSMLESTERVFEIQLIDLKARRTMSVESYADLLGLAEPLFRGSVLTHYERGRWIPDTMPVVPSRAFRVIENSSKEIEIQQIIRMDDTSSGVLFCLGQPLMMTDEQHQLFGEYNYTSGLSYRNDEANDGGALTYSAFSRKPQRAQSNYKLPISSKLLEYYERSQYLVRNKRIPNRLNRVKSLTTEIIEAETSHRQTAENRLTPRELTPLEIANAIESHLRDSGQYRYTIDLSIQDSKIDPVEDFLINRKAGHCEYFATALCLMLRAADIPARIVGGYKGGIPHSDKKDTFEVQQRFAHLWVEAWVDRQGWTTFDATPEDGRSLSIAAVSAKQKSIWAGVQSTFSGLWNENILNMSLDRQEESIYKPIRQFAVSVSTFVRQMFTSPKSAHQIIWEFLTNREQWMSIGGALVALSTAVCLFAVVWIARRIYRPLRRWLANRSGTVGPRRRQIVEFYERFVRLAEARGLRRGPFQTQLEFAEQFASAYSPELSHDTLGDSPCKISQLFYRVRFGDEELSAADCENLDDLLLKLDRALSNENKRQIPV